MNTDNIYSPYFIDSLEMTKDKQSWDIFANKFISLPEKIKDAMLASEIVESVALNLSLTESQSADLSRLIRDVLLGDLFIGDMITKISENLNVDQATAQQIQSKVLNGLFAPAIEDIKKIQREKFPDRIGQGSGIPQPPLPPQMKNGPNVNQSNVINLRDNTTNY